MYIDADQERESGWYWVFTFRGYVPAYWDGGDQLWFDRKGGERIRQGENFLRIGNRMKEDPE